jgi:hypothetical protein
MSINWRVLWGNMTEKEVSMLMKENAGKSFCEVVRWVNGSVNALENDEVPLDPITQRKVFYVDVTRAWSGFFVHYPSMYNHRCLCKPQ